MLAHQLMAKKGINLDGQGLRKHRAARSAAPGHAGVMGVDYAAMRPVAGDMATGTPAGGLCAGAGQRPRWVRIFSMTSGCSMTAMRVITLMFHEAMRRNEDGGTLP